MLFKTIINLDEWQLTAKLLLLYDTFYYIHSYFIFILNKFSCICSRVKFDGKVNETLQVNFQRYRSSDRSIRIRNV